MLIKVSNEKKNIAIRQVISETLLMFKRLLLRMQHTVGARGGGANIIQSKKIFRLMTPNTATGGNKGVVLDRMEAR